MSRDEGIERALAKPRRHRPGTVGNRFGLQQPALLPLENARHEALGRPDAPAHRHFPANVDASVDAGGQKNERRKKRSKFGVFEEREKGFEPSTLALASRLGPPPGGADACQDSPTLRHSEGLEPTGCLQRLPRSLGPLGGFPVPDNVDGHVDGVEEEPTSD